MDRVVLLDKYNKILDVERFMWTHTKQNYDKHVEWMENWKDIAKEED
jgi:site-specific recombinase XerC